MDHKIEIPSNLIEDLKSSFQREVMTCKKKLLRQGDRLEEHIFEKGLITNGLLQSHVNKQDFPRFSHDLLAIITGEQIKGFLERKYGKKFLLVQSMVFHQNPKTSLHTDDIYLDSSNAGELVGVLFAFEDFSPENGSLDVRYASSSEIDGLFSRVNLRKDFVSFDDLYEYRGSYLDLLKSNYENQEFITPWLKKGEYIDWLSFVPHRSHVGTNPEKSRFSCAAHYIPVGTTFTTRFGGNDVSLAERFTSEMVAL